MDLKCLREINCKQGAIRAVRFNVDGEYCLTCGADKKIKLWNPLRSLFLKEYGGHGGDVLDVCGSCDSSQIVSCADDKTVILWDVSTGQSLRRYRGHAGRVNCVKFNEDSSVAVSGGQDNTVIFWDVKSKNYNPIQVLREAKDGITSVLVVAHEIITSSLDCSIRCYDIRMGRMVSDFVGESISCLRLTRDSQCYIVSTSDDVLRLFDKSTGELLAEFSGHQSKDFMIENCMSSKDSHVLSGSADGNVYCWELVSQKLVKLLPHKGSHVVHSISPHPTTESYLTAAGASVYLWGSQEDSEDEENG